MNSVFLVSTLEGAYHSNKYVTFKNMIEMKVSFLV